MEIVRRFFRDSNQSYFLFGPRGVGKSTWVNRQFPDGLYIDLLDPEIFRSYTARPERLRDVVAAQPSDQTIIIDEIQKTPQLLDVIHQLLERQQGWRFILTGSSSRKLKRAGVDLLAGRALNKTMHPFMAAELGERFSLESALKIGLVPLVVNAAEPLDTLNAYAALYVTVPTPFVPSKQKIRSSYVPKYSEDCAPLRRIIPKQTSAYCIVVKNA